MASTADNHYYVPHGAYWPLVGSVGLATTLGGFAAHLNDSPSGLTVTFAGVAILVVMMFGWFGTVVKESEGGQVQQLGRQVLPPRYVAGSYFPRSCSSPRFSARSSTPEDFLGALAARRRVWGKHSQLSFGARFRRSGRPTAPKDMGGSDFHMGWWPLPFINTVILLTSGRDGDHRPPCDREKRPQAALSGACSPPWSSASYSSTCRCRGISARIP